MKSGLQAYRDMPGADQVALLKGQKRDKNGDIKTKETVEIPLAFSSAPGKAAFAAYLTPEEAQGIRMARQGFSEEGRGEEVGLGLYQHTGPGGLMSFNGQGGAGPGGGDAGDDTGGMGGTSEGEANAASADNDGGETGEATDDVSSPGGSPLGGGGYGGGYGGSGDGGISEAVGDAVGRALGVNGFMGTGRGFGGFGRGLGAVTAAGEMVGEMARDAGMSVSTPTAAVNDDPSTSRNEANDPSAFGGGNQGNSGGPSSEPAPTEVSEETGGTETSVSSSAWTPDDWNEDAFLRTHPEVARSVASGTWDSGYEFNDAWRRFSGQDYDAGPPTPRSRNADSYRTDFLNTPSDGVMPYRGFNA